jgi:hypothetical protein
MKWLLLIFSVVKPLLSSAHENGHQSLNPVNDIKDMIKENAMKVVTFFAFASILSTLFASGIIIIAVNISNQYDLNNYVIFNSMIGTGIGLSLVSLLIGFAVVRTFQGENIKDQEKKSKKDFSVAKEHPIQDALALLVTDFIKEREYKREVKRQYRTGRTQASDYNERVSTNEDSQSLSRIPSEEYEVRKH